jgi:hypothetical protein
MKEAIGPLVLLVAVAAWVLAELRAGAGVRIILGVVSMGLVGLLWFSAAQRAAYLDASHQAVFREIGKLLDVGNVEQVKRAVDAYNHPDPGEARVYQALDVTQQ